MGSSQSVSAATFEEKLNISHSNTTGNLVVSQYEKLNNARQFYDASLHYPPHRSNSVRNAISQMSHTTNKNNINQKIKKFATVAVSRLGLKHARPDVKDVKYNIKETEQQITDNIKSNSAPTCKNKNNNNNNNINNNNNNIQENKQKATNNNNNINNNDNNNNNNDKNKNNNNNNNNNNIKNNNNNINNQLAVCSIESACPDRELTQFEQICQEMNIITRVNKSSVGLLLKAFGRYCVKLSSSMSVRPGTSEIAKWVIGMDKALQDCRWTGKNFVCESHLVFIFMLMKNLAEEQTFYNVRDLKEAIYVCLYISYTYNANEISYPARPFLSLGQDRNKFFQDCVRLGLKCSSEMLDINANRDTYKKYLSLLLSYA